MSLVRTTGLAYIVNVNVRAIMDANVLLLHMSIIGGGDIRIAMLPVVE